jgi:TolB-like protein/tetratricopeptide (TPR) repeat protein
VTEPSHAVFLSYASQDAQAARKICEALRAAGIEVWLDQSELRGGDAWDESIRDQIKACALFMPVISANAHARVEGYFRLEWKLAVDRSHRMAPKQPFLLPVVIDDTPQSDDAIPDRFRELQWTRLPGGATPATFVERVRRLLSGEPAQGPTGTASAAAHVPAALSSRKPLLALWRSKAALLVTIAVVVVALGYLVANRLVLSKRAAEVGAALAPAAQSAPATAFAPPPHSVAVLPFVNMSGDKDQEYFSDGLTEEILNSLARINELQVSARTSSFSFKGKDADISTIAHKLNVASVLEGSVRRAGNTVRVTAQLNSAVTGFHLWSQTYDRDLSNVLQLQTEIANAVANALKVALLGDVAAKIEAGGTRNPAAFDAYLRASMAYWTEEKDRQAPIARYTEAIALDPDYALAYADRSVALVAFAEGFASGPEVPDYLNKAQADALRAIALAPDLGQSHMALALFYEHSLDFAGASQEYSRAVALAPGNARILRNYGLFAALMGQTEPGLAAVHRSVALDPLNASAHGWLGTSLLVARRYTEAVVALNDSQALDPKDTHRGNVFTGYAYYWNGNFERARAECESADENFNPFCLAMAYDKLGRHSDAKTMLARLQASRWGTAHPSLAAITYGEWGDTARALDWLERAMRQRDTYLEYVKAAMFFDPLRKEPRFQAVERALKFPS